MKPTIPAAYMLFILISMNLSGFGQGSEPSSGKKYRNPEHIENKKAIQGFETLDKKQPPPQGAIVCIGSSSMRGWHGAIRSDLTPLTVVPRGFGGSNMNDALHYADKIVLPYKPRAVVVYEGDNDIAQGISPQKISETFMEFVEKIHKQLPECRIYFLSIKPSISRWELWPKMKQANSLIAEVCAKDKRLTFVNVASGMLNNDGNPRINIFKKDKLHMTRDGYVIWRDALRPILMKSELRYEAQGSAESSETREGASNKQLKATDESAP